MSKTTIFSDALFVAEDVVAGAEADAATAMSLSKPAQLDHHVATDLAILLLTKKKPMLKEKPRLKRLILDALFADGVEAEVDAAIAMSLSKLAQLDHHVATDLVILLMKLMKRPLLKRTPFSDACSDVAETVQKLMKSLKILPSSHAQGETEVEAATTDATRTRRRKRLKKLKALHVVRLKDDEGHDAPDVWKRPFQTVQLRSLD